MSGAVNVQSRLQVVSERLHVWSIPIGWDREEGGNGWKVGSRACIFLFNQTETSTLCLDYFWESLETFGSQDIQAVKAAAMSGFCSLFVPPLSMFNQ